MYDMIFAWDYSVAWLPLLNILFFVFDYLLLVNIFVFQTLLFEDYSFCLSIIGKIRQSAENMYMFLIFFFLLFACSADLLGGELRSEKSNSQYTDSSAAM